jgi:hypothetical protein
LVRTVGEENIAGVQQLEDEEEVATKTKKRESANWFTKVLGERDNRSC